MRILSIQQVALTTSPDGTEVPLVFENGVFYKIFGNGFESAPFNHDSDNVNFLPVGQGYPTPVLGVIADGKLKLYTTYAPVDYVQLLEFADDSYVYREEVRESMIDNAELNKLCVAITQETETEIVTSESMLTVTSATLNSDGSILLRCNYDSLPTPVGNNEGYIVYVEAYGRKYFPYYPPNSTGLNARVVVTGHLVIDTVFATITFQPNKRFVKVLSHDDYT